MSEMSAKSYAKVNIFLKIADKIDYYVENLANFDGYKTNNDIFLKNHQTYTKIITYYEKVRGYYGTSLRATNKLLKKLILPKGIIKNTTVDPIDIKNTYSELISSCGEEPYCMIYKK